jgi:hypothetical protein
MDSKSRYIIMPEDLVGLMSGKDYDRKHFFKEVRDTIVDVDIDPHMFCTESARNITEESLPSRPITIFGFTTIPLLEWMAKNERDANKLVKAATTYGYMGTGSESGGINGILKLHKGDVALLRQYNAFFDNCSMSIHAKEFLVDVGGFSDPENVSPVKIVAHVPSGDRILGALGREPKGSRYDLRALFFTTGNYND